MLGQLLAHVCDLDCMLPKEYLKKAILSVFNNDFHLDFPGHNNAQRTYVLDDEKGMLWCAMSKESE